MAITKTRSVAVKSNERPVKVLVLGGSYGGMAVAVNLADLCAGKAPRFGVHNQQPGYRIPVEITIVDERDGYYHLIGSPLALAQEDYAGKAWIKFDDIPALKHTQFQFKHGSVEGIELAAKIATFRPHKAAENEHLDYDYLVVATGLRRAWPSVPQTLTRSEYLQEVQPHIERVSKAEHGVAVIGGGAVGIEMAAELRMVCPNVRVILIHSREQLLSSEPLPDDFKAQTLTLLQDAGVETLMGKRVQSTSCDEDSEKKTIHLSDGSELMVSEVINAVSGPKPTTSYLPTEALNADGEVKINSNLTFASTVPNADAHFAIGDLIPQPGVKRCGGAMHHGHYAAFNIHQHLLLSRGIIDEPRYQELADHGVNIGLAMGKKAIGYSEQTGIMAGEDTLKYLFGDDLGFKYCWDYLKLGEKMQNEDAAELEQLLEPEDLVGTVGDHAVAATVKA